jgi:hypothetical protein
LECVVLTYNRIAFGTSIYPWEQPGVISYGAATDIGDGS